ncbi:hypothetical protein FE257_002021 [Aspergillus nanangensis]|uniref:Major facilitator superfamily (MFS) profile domain-containing protein n=1 Tax=Aspergillus nanangensis TaxID=2582783 RepID=A0AAD4GW06_ASPNN|nr:hypothetical protein FE257_002021 [Aspergillus nanangensis]
MDVKNVKEPHVEEIGIEEIESNSNDPPKPPDGGLRAWMAVAGACAAQMTYQTYYSTYFLLDYSPSSISWIDALQPFFVFGLGLISGPLSDRFGPRVVIVPSGIVLVFSVMITSLSKKYYQVLLS